LLEQAVAGIGDYDTAELDRAGLMVNIFSALKLLTGQTPTRHSYLKRFRPTHFYSLPLNQRFIPMIHM
jgi:hypothetical protein